MAVPTHFFKILVFAKPDGEKNVEGYIIPNRYIEHSQSLQDFRQSIETIERVAELLFTCVTSGQRYVSKQKQNSLKDSLKIVAKRNIVRSFIRGYSKKR